MSETNEFLKKTRAKWGYSLSDFADILCTDIDTVEKWENGVWRVPEIARAYVLSIYKIKSLQTQTNETYEPPSGVLDVPADGMPHDFNMPEFLNNLQDRFIREAMRKANGNKTEAARLLGIQRTTLQEKIKKQDLGTEFANITRQAVRDFHRVNNKGIHDKVSNGVAGDNEL